MEEGITGNEVKELRHSGDMSSIRKEKSSRVMSGLPW